MSNVTVRKMRRPVEKSGPDVEELATCCTTTSGVVVVVGASVDVVVEDEVVVGRLVCATASDASTIHAPTRALNESANARNNEFVRH